MEKSQKSTESSGANSRTTWFSLEIISISKKEVTLMWVKEGAVFGQYFDMHFRTLVYTATLS